MKTLRKQRGPRPGSIARVPGIDYGGLDDLLGYELRRAQLAGFEAFHRAPPGGRGRLTGCGGAASSLPGV